MQLFFLALRAEISAAAAHHDSFHRTSADGAGLLLSVSHVELEMGGTQRAVRAHIVHYACPLAYNSRFEHNQYSIVETFDFRRFQAAGEPFRVDSRGK